MYVRLDKWSIVEFDRWSNNMLQLSINMEHGYTLQLQIIMLKERNIAVSFILNPDQKDFDAYLRLGYVKVRKAPLG